MPKRIREDKRELMVETALAISVYLAARMARQRKRMAAALIRLRVRIVTSI